MCVSLESIFLCAVNSPNDWSRSQITAHTGRSCQPWEHTHTPFTPTERLSARLSWVSACIKFLFSAHNAFAGALSNLWNARLIDIFYFGCVVCGCEYWTISNSKIILARPSCLLPAAVSATVVKSLQEIENNNNINNNNESVEPNSIWQPIYIPLSLLNLCWSFWTKRGIFGFTEYREYTQRQSGTLNSIHPLGWCWDMLCGMWWHLQRSVARWENISRTEKCDCVLAGFG